MTTRKPLYAIVAASPEGGIGYMNQIPWKLSGDLPRFRRMTMNNVVIVGRNTFESLPKGLPGRQVIVVSEKLANGVVSFQKDVHYAKCLSDAIEKAQELDGPEVYIAGGTRLYEEAMGLPCVFILTTVYQKAKEGYDAFIRDFNFKDFECVMGPDPVFIEDPNNGLSIISHTYSVYKPKGTRNGN